jgi:hypothetical protein
MASFEGCQFHEVKNHSVAKSDNELRGRAIQVAFDGGEVRPRWSAFERERDGRVPDEMAETGPLFDVRAVRNQIASRL